MDMRTGDIVGQEDIDKMTHSERQRYTRLTQSEYDGVKDLNRHQRRKALAESRRAKRIAAQRGEVDG